MASNSSILIDKSLLSKLDQGLHKIESLFALISGLAVFSLMMLAVISVTGRHSINQPLPGYVDWIEQAMPLIAFMGIAYTQRNGGHIRMDILVSFLKGRSLWAVEFITVLFMLLVMILIIWGSWAHFARSFDFSAPMWSRDSSMDIAIPLWPAKILAPIAFSLLAVRLMLQLISFGKAFVYNETRPTAVPLVESAAAQAAKEASSVSG